MKLVLVFGIIAVFGTTFASPSPKVTVTRKGSPAPAVTSKSLPGSLDSFDQWCNWIPEPNSEAYADICHVASSPSSSKACDLVSALKNACGCYQDDVPGLQEYCVEVAESAAWCDQQCGVKQGGMQASAKSASLPLQMCDITNRDSKYSECNYKFAEYNICNCYGSPYFKDKTGKHSCKLAFDAAATCNKDCDASGNCKKL